ncbi:DNA-processing protein DprA [Bacteroidales bacterium]
MSEQLLYQIGLTLIPGVGDVLGKKLVAYCGGPEAVFSEKKRALEKIPGIGAALIHEITHQNVLGRAEQEMDFITKKGIQPLFFLDKKYPKRLQHCADSPLMLYYYGNADLNMQKVIGIVGTRKATDYGKHWCEQFIEELSTNEVLIVSGLAYGIDSCAHRASLKYHLPTIGVLAHGLDRIYPPSNRGMAERMVTQGGLLTEFMAGTTPDRENFPRRNRIVAGMVDAIVVIESAKKGGALITANIASSYNRDVFALPGRVGDFTSEGCNYLIRTNKADMIENAENLRYMLGWDTHKQASPQTRLFRDFSEDEQKILDAFGDDKESGIDDIMLKSTFPASKLAGLLLGLEFDGVLVALPGKRYKIA